MQLKFEHFVSCPIEEVFAFFSEPSNLEELMSAWPNFRLLHHAGNVDPGSMTWFEETVFGILPVVHGFRHVVCDPPRAFVDELVHGPYDRFRHLHEFESSRGGTIVRDRIEIRLRWMYGGEAATRRCLAPRLEKIFQIRNLRSQQILSSRALGVGGLSPEA